MDDLKQDTTDTKHVPAEAMRAAGLAEAPGSGDGTEELADALTAVLKGVWKHPKVRGTCTGEPNWAAIKVTIKLFAIEMSRPNTEVSESPRKP